MTFISTKLNEIPEFNTLFSFPFAHIQFFLFESTVKHFGAQFDADFGPSEADI